MTWIQTLDGKAFDLLRPDPKVIDPHVLAVVLSRICRFGGHCIAYYSVAQHSWLVESIVTEDDPELRLAALLHDAHEAYWGLGDVLRPAKVMMGGSQMLEAHCEAVNDAIATRFGFDPVLFGHPSIKHADNVLLATEARDLMEPHPQPWAPLPEPLNNPVIAIGNHAAELMFEDRLKELMEAA